MPLHVVILSAVDRQGGASRAAYRLHCALKAQGVRSRMLVQKKTCADEDIQQITSGSHRPARLWDAIQQCCIDQQRSEGWNTYFSLGLPGVDLLGHPWVREADVIHLHWVAGFVTHADVGRLQSLGKPIVWTLHDQRAFTGGCHYSAGCTGYETDCAACPQLRPPSAHLPAALLSDQVSAVQWSRVRVVTPSRWLAGAARRSSLFRNASIDCIPYGVDTALFSPERRAEARARLDLKPGTFCLLFGADYIAEKRKGYPQLIEALKLCLNDPSFSNSVRTGRVQLLCFGNPDANTTAIPVPVRSLGYLNGDVEVARCYAAVDLFLLPSLQDNLPLTMLESMSCGTPVMAFAAGGIAEVVEDGVSGGLAPVGDVDALARGILRFHAQRAQMGHWRSAARARMLESHSPEREAAAYLELYSRLVESNVQFVNVSAQTGSLGPRTALLLRSLLQMALSTEVVRAETGHRHRFLSYLVRNVGEWSEVADPEKLLQFAARGFQIAGASRFSQWRFKRAWQFRNYVRRMFT